MPVSSSAVVPFFPFFFFSPPTPPSPRCCAADHSLLPARSRIFNCKRLSPATFLALRYALAPPPISAFRFLAYPRDRRRKGSEAEGWGGRHGRFETENGRFHTRGLKKRNASRGNEASKRESDIEKVYKEENARKKRVHGGRGWKEDAEPDNTVIA